jgi:hypothetical protein
MNELNHLELSQDLSRLLQEDSRLRSLHNSKVLVDGSGFYVCDSEATFILASLGSGSEYQTHCVGT